VAKINGVYKIINLVVLALACFIFILEYRTFFTLFADINFLAFLVIAGTVIIVHSIKAFRLYFTLYGTNINFVTYMKVYCKVTPISLLFPFKIGEFFRMYCYGEAIGDRLRGIIIICFDRFVDTVALLTSIVLVSLFNWSKISSFAYILVIFVFVFISCYLVFPSIYRNWKSYLLHSKATPGKIQGLKSLETFNKIYKEINIIAKGRGAILYFMSLLAWGVEMGGLTLVSRLNLIDEYHSSISDYLSSAMRGNAVCELQRFIILSIIFTIILYCVLKCVEFAKSKRATL